MLKTKIMTILPSSFSFLVLRTLFFSHLQVYLFNKAWNSLLNFTLLGKIYLKNNIKNLLKKIIFFISLNLMFHDL